MKYFSVRTLETGRCRKEKLGETMHDAIFFWKKGYNFFLVELAGNRDETTVSFSENKRK